jgi:GT2 family glycosyltransferase
MTIHYITPFAQDLNIGKSYNECISQLSNDWICLRDHDTLLFPNSGNIIPAIIEANPDYQLFTAVTNRIGVNLHCVAGMFDDDSILSHQNKADELWDTYQTNVLTTGVAPGFCMIFKKSLWEQVGGFTENSIFFDREFSNAAKKCGAKIGLAMGLYIFHLYRYGKNKKDISHLLK